MDNFNGYKLKPKSHKIQAGDIVIKILSNTGSKLPSGSIGIVKDLGNTLTTPTGENWSFNHTNWRAIETLPGSEARAGDTVYCIGNTYGACNQHDSFVVRRVNNKFIYPESDHRLLNGTITREGWNWSTMCFVVLVKADAKETQEFPCFRRAITHKHIVKFTSPTKGTVVDVGEEYINLNYTSEYWVAYDNYEVWEPCEDPTIAHIPVDTAANPCFEISLVETSDLENFIDRIVSNYGPVTYLVTPTIKQTNTKGKTMNTNLFTDILKLLSQAEQTDLQKAPEMYAFFYDEEGNYEGTAKVANESEAKKLLQKPEHLGYTMRIYSFSDEFTTQIPVVSTIKPKTVAVKPARKTRVSKA